MPKGHWSFIHEWVIYDYLTARFEEGTLRLKKIIGEGKVLGRTKWNRVSGLNEISNTNFPDIEGIKLVGQSIFRPAEVKFTTSLFNYHYEKKYNKKFQDFISNNGFIIVAGHDYLPVNGLLEKYPQIDVYEIEVDDFISFCRENFIRLLNRQTKSHSQTRVWILYQGPNFNEGINKIKPARESLIWCPTENLTGFDLAIGDRVLFIKSKGIGRIQLQNKLQKDGEIDLKWILSEICIAEVTSKIFSRKEYCDHKSYDYNTKQLWKNDDNTKGKWRWSRVFEFSIVNIINREINMRDLYASKRTTNFSRMCWEAFCYGKSREITQKDYRNLIEDLLM